MPTIFETERLRLRTWEDRDTTPMGEINKDPKVMEFFPAIQDHEETIQLIERIIAHQKKHGFSLYAVELKETNEFIGFVGLNYPEFDIPNIDRSIPEIGWRLAAKHWGKGYATEAAKAVLDYGFKKLGIKEIISFTAKINKRSIRIMEKIGMQHDPKGDFDHPKLEDGHGLKAHVLYRLKAS